MDQGLSSSKPEHFDLRAIRQAAGGESLFPSSRLPLSCIRPVRISSKSGIHQEKVQAHRKVRYADRVGDKMAVRHKICADRLPVGERKGTVLPITVIEEASRKRFIYAYQEHSSYSTIDFIKRSITYFGYAPKEIQTDCGSEFTHTAKTKRVHPFDVFCKRYHILHHVLRPRTPWHNGKVERSHRNDQERFYNYLSFYSFADLQEQMKRYLRRSNNIPMAVLGWKSPAQKHRELESRHA